MVAARIVNAETGEILAAGDANLPRAGLIAFSEDVVVTRSKSGAAIRSLLLPGWGQLYNGNSGLGMLLLGGALGVLGGAATFAVLGNSAASEYQEGTLAGVPARETANQRFQTANLLLITYGALALLSSAEAWVSGRSATNIQVQGSAGPGQASLGLSFSF